MTRRIALILLTVLSLSGFGVCSRAYADPADYGLTVSSEIFINPGVKYDDWFRSYRSWAQRTSEGMTFFASHAAGSGLVAYPYDRDGNSIGLGSHRLGIELLVLDAIVEPDAYVILGIDTHSAPMGMKLSRHPRSDYGDEVQSAILAQGHWQEDTARSIWGRICKAGDRYVAVWEEDSGVHIVRLNLQFEVESHEVLDHEGGSYSLIPSGDRAVLAWVPDPHSVAITFIPPTGAPETKARIEAEAIRQTSIVAVDSGFLLATLDEHARAARWILLDSDGIPQSEWNVREADVRDGISLVAGDRSALLCWRDQLRIYGQLLNLDGTGRRTPVGIAVTGGWGPDDDQHRNRRIDTAWDGDRFVVLWNDRFEWTTATGFADCAGPHHQYAAWVTAEGVSVNSYPDVINVAYQPGSIWVQHLNGKYRCLMQGTDWRSSQPFAYQWVDVDPFTNLVTPVGDHTLLGNDDRCREHLWSKEFRAGESSLFLGIAMESDWEYTWRYGQAVLEVRSDGSHVWRKGVAGEGEWAFDADATSTWHLFSDRDPHLPRRTTAIRYSLDDRETRWTVQMEVPATGLLRTLQDGALAIWPDIHDGVRELWYRAIKSDEPSGLVEGKRLFPDYETDFQRGTLIDGPNGLVLFYTIAHASDPDSSLLYGARFNADGVVEQNPHFITTIPKRDFQAIWDGERYFILYDGGYLHLLRVRRSMELIDQEPIRIPQIWPFDFHVATDGNGTLAIGYNGNRFRTITSDRYAPVLLTGLGARWTESGVELSWELAFDAFSECQVLRELEGELTRINDDPIEARVGPMRYLDRTASPGGAYEYFVVGIDRDGEEMRFGPVHVVAGEATDARLDLAVRPNPSNAEVWIDLVTPRAGETIVEVFDPAGRRVWSETVRSDRPGQSTVIWPAADGSRLASGVYLVQARSGNKTASRPITIMR